MRRFTTATLAAIVLAAAPLAASADEFAEVLEQARKAYADGDLAATNEELKYATQLLGQMRAAKLEALLPAAPSGWTRAEAKSQNAAGMAMFGGGMTAEATYKKDRERVVVSVLTESPMVASMAMMFDNAAIAGAQGTLKRIEREKVLIKPEGELMSLIDNRILVTVKGKSGADTLEQFFRAIDLKALKAF